MKPFDPKIVEEVGTKVYAQKYPLRNGHKILRVLETLELAIRSRFVRRRGRFKQRISTPSAASNQADWLIGDHRLNWLERAHKRIFFFLIKE